LNWFEKACAVANATADLTDAARPRLDEPSHQEQNTGFKVGVNDNLFFYHKERKDRREGF
jgi:hypothetical protein